MNQKYYIFSDILRSVKEGKESFKTAIYNHLDKK
jgi:hypothetical protein